MKFQNKRQKTNKQTNACTLSHLPVPTPNLSRGDPHTYNNAHVIELMINRDSV